MLVGDGVGVGVVLPIITGEGKLWGFVTTGDVFGWRNLTKAQEVNPARMTTQPIMTATTNGLSIIELPFGGIMGSGLGDDGKGAGRCPTAIVWT